MAPDSSAEDFELFSDKDQLQFLELESDVTDSLSHDCGGDFRRN